MKYLIGLFVVALSGCATYAPPQTTVANYASCTYAGACVGDALPYNSPFGVGGDGGQ